MKRILAFACLVAVAAGCVREEVQEPLDAEHKIYARIIGDETKVQLNSARKTVWTAGDQITVLGEYGGYNYSEWTFDGQTGDRGGSFSLNSYGTYPGIDFGGKYHSLYGPYGDLTVMDEKLVLFSEVLAAQTYIPGSYGLQANVMYGTSDDGTDFRFSNMLGYLRLGLAGDKVVDRIVLSGNKGETLAGDFYFFTDDFQTLHWNGNSSRQIVMDCGDGVQLTDEPVDFYFVLPPMTFGSGISVEIHFRDGSFYPQTTTKSLTIERNTILHMSEINTGDAHWQTVSLYHTGELIYAPYFSGGTALSGMMVWGDGQTTVLGSVESHRFTDSQPSHTVQAKVKDADFFRLDSCEGISKIDLSGF